jgi:hypothetical protein
LVTQQAFVQVWEVTALQPIGYPTTIMGNKP